MIRRADERERPGIMKGDADGESNSVFNISINFSTAATYAILMKEKSPKKDFIKMLAELLFIILVRKMFIFWLLPVLRGPLTSAKERY